MLLGAKLGALDGVVRGIAIGVTTGTGALTLDGALIGTLIPGGVGALVILTVGAANIDGESVLLLGDTTGISTLIGTFVG